MSEQTKMQQEFKERMDEDELLNCMRCGFCLPSCPTYIESGFKESHSPRGRIALMKAVVDGVIEPDEDVERSLDLCLGCRACEPVCPSGVKYGHLLEEARDIINKHKKHSIREKVVRKTMFSGLFPHPDRMRTATSLLGFYQRSGIQKAVRASGLMNIFPDHLSTMEKILPPVPRRRDMAERPRHLEPAGPRKKKVAFFSGCLMDTLFLSTNNATTTLLQHAGCEIVIPRAQTCCGALHGHSGEKDGAKKLAKENISAFEDCGADYIITNAGGCGAFLVDYDHLLKDDPDWKARAKRFASKIKDVSSILVELGFHRKALQTDSQIITYQDSCHLRNVQKTFLEPRMLLQAVSGAEYREMKQADHCCGSAGIYNIVESEMSMKILDTKMKHARGTGAVTIITSNPGCLLQMKLGIEREGLSNTVRAVHIVDFLLEAIPYKKEG